jgi:hypothetical protein
MSNNYIFSPGSFTILQPNLETKNWTDLNINSNLDMYVQFEILITTYNPNWRNIFHFTDNGESNRTPAMFVDPDSTSLSYSNSSVGDIDYSSYIVTPPIPFNTPTLVTMTAYNNTINTYFNSVLQNIQTIPGGTLIPSSESTILYICDPWNICDGGIQIKNLTFGNLSDSMKCGRYNFCLGIEPDNNVYCYGGGEGGCLWGGPYCTSDEQCKAEYNITSPKYNSSYSSKEICSIPPQDCNCWESDACPNTYNLNIANNPCSYQMNSAELQCYQKNNPDLKELIPSQLQQNWESSGCKEQRNNKCPSYQTNSGLYNYIGCYNGNQVNEIIPLPNNRGLVNSIDDCQAIASNNNESLFGVHNAAGNGGRPQCFTGNDVNRAKKYDLNVNRNQCAPLGGNSTYQVYQRTKPFPPPVPALPILTTSNFANSIETFENRKYNKLLILLFIIFIIWIFYIYKK